MFVGVLRETRKTSVGGTTTHTSACHHQGIPIPQPTHLTLFRAMTMFCEIDIILWKIPHIQRLLPVLFPLAIPQSVPDTCWSVPGAYWPITKVLRARSPLRSRRLHVPSPAALFPAMFPRLPPPRLPSPRPYSFPSFSSDFTIPLSRRSLGLGLQMYVVKINQKKYTYFGSQCKWCASR